MSYKAPTRGNLLQLWDKISPEQGYSREEIEKIAKDDAISDYTVGNLLNTRREYLIFNPDDQLYYRNDSALAAQIPAPAQSSVSKSAKAKKTKPTTSKSVASKSTQSKSKSVEPQENAKISPESIAHKIFASTERLKEAKLRIEQVTAEKQQLELEENSLNSEINELEASLQSIQIFL